MDKVFSKMKHSQVVLQHCSPAAGLDYSDRTLIAVPALMIYLCYHLVEFPQHELSINWGLLCQQD